MQLISIGQFHKVIEKYLYWLSLPSIGFTDILEIIIISVIVYQMLKWVQLTRAWTLFKGIIMLLLFALFAAIFQLNTISWLLSNSLGVGITAAIIIFQPELRRALEQLGRKKIFSNLFFFLYVFFNFFLFCVICSFFVYPLHSTMFLLIP